MRDSLGRFMKGNINPVWVMDRLKERMRNDNPAKSPEVRIKISEGKAALKGWITRKKGYKAFMQKQREYKRRCNGGSHTFEDWEKLKEKHQWSCVNCGKKEPNIKLTRDHIIPICKGGTNNIENIQPLCSMCNSIKGGRYSFSK